MDEIIDLLLDGQWHLIDDLAKMLDIDQTQLLEALHFFEQYGFVRMDHPRNRVSIDTVIQALYQT